MPTIFLEVAWQPLPESQDLSIKHFLKDSESLIRVVDLLGTQMKPVRGDMLGNVKKIADSYAKNCPDKEYLHELLEVEIASGINKKDPSASIGLLWLKRGLEYFYEFMRIIYEGLADETLNDNLSDVAKRAYEITLKQHHNWLMNKTFSCVSHFTPKKATLLKNLTQDDASLIDQLPGEMLVLLESMAPVIAKTNELLSKYDLEK